MAVLDWKELQEHPAYRYLQMEQEVATSDGKKIITTRCPVRINGETLTNGKAAPQLGENTFSIIKEFQDNPMQTVIRPCIAETV
jgi:crotonobetainyl-CoA:carnitine CoA-transferase CaiB-like acyl-CoA transferase